MALANQSNTDTSPSSSTSAFTGRMRGLDAIRYVCALWVVLGHMGSPFRHIQHPNILIKLFTNVFQAGISGPAAVIVFFVVSGLCIHFNYRNGEKLDYFSYYMRRYVRIGLPLLVVVAVIQSSSHTHFHSISIASLNNSVLWSLIAELIYYTLYPALMLAKNKLGWQNLILSAFVVAYAVVFSHPLLAQEGHYPDFGWKLNWLIGLPCWLLGCLLAERLPGNQADELVKTKTPYWIWKWRVAAWLASSITLLLQFHQHNRHLHLGYSLTLNVFAIFVFFWLRNEIAYYQVNKPLNWLEKAGKGSYSLYLVHPILLAGFLSQVFHFDNALLNWSITLCEILIFSTLFHFVVEKPSHRLARLFRPRQANSAVTFTAVI